VRWREIAREAGISIPLGVRSCCLGADEDLLKIVWLCPDIVLSGIKAIELIVYQVPSGSDSFCLRLFSSSRCRYRWFVSHFPSSSLIHALNGFKDARSTRIDPFFCGRGRKSGRISFFIVSLHITITIFTLQQENICIGFSWNALTDV